MTSILIPYCDGRLIRHQRFLSLPYPEPLANWLQALGRDEQSMNPPLLLLPVGNILFSCGPFAEC